MISYLTFMNCYFVRNKIEVTIYDFNLQIKSATKIVVILSLFTRYLICIHSLLHPISLVTFLWFTIYLLIISLFRNSHLLIIN